MVENPNTAEPARKPRNRYQFGLSALLISVTLLGLLAGATRWLFILVGSRVAVGVLLAFLLTTGYVVGCSRFFWLWKEWCRRRSIRDQAWEIEAIRILLESTEINEAIRAAEAGPLLDADSGETEPR